MSETSLLIPKRKRSRTTIKYKFQLIKSRGAMMVLFWDFLFHFYGKNILFVLSEISYNITGYASIILLGIYPQLNYILYLFYPIGGLMGDAWIGRYKTIITSVWFSFIILLATVICYLVSEVSIQHSNRLTIGDRNYYHC